MKRHILGIVKIGFALIVLWYLSHKSFLDFHLLKLVFFSPYWITLIAVLYITVVIVSAWRWKKLLNVQHIPLNLSQTITPTYLGIAFNNLLPGGIGGDFYRCYFLFKQYPDKRSAIMLSILFDRLIGLMGVFILVAGFTIFDSKLANLHRYALYIFSTSCIFLFGFVFLLYFSNIMQKFNFINQLKSRFHHKSWYRVFISLSDAIATYKNNKLDIIKCILSSVLIQILIVITCRCLANIMNFPTISFPDYAIALGLTQIVNLIPISPGGFGVGEAAFAKIIQLLNPGMIGTFATIFLAYRVIGLLLYLPALSVFLFKFINPSLTTDTN